MDFGRGEAQPFPYVHKQIFAYVAKNAFRNHFGGPNQQKKLDFFKNILVYISFKNILKTIKNYPPTDHAKANLHNFFLYLK